jgi:hypothetical protein
LKALALLWRLIVKVAVLIDRIDDAWLALKKLFAGDDEEEEKESDEE